MPKKLKLGISASWNCDTSEWGASSFTPSETNWNVGGGWNAGDDIWNEVNHPSDTAPSETWDSLYDWREPPPDISAEENFPSLAPVKHSKRTKVAPAPNQNGDRSIPVDFADLLGTRDHDTSKRPCKDSSERTPHSNQEHRTLQPYHVAPKLSKYSSEQSQSLHVKRSSKKSAPQSDPPPSSKLKLEKPNQSLQELLCPNIADMIGKTAPNKLLPLSENTGSVEPDKTDGTKVLLDKYSSPSERASAKHISGEKKSMVKSSPSVPIVKSLNELDAPTPEKDIYEQLQTQLKKFKGIDNLVYIIQNGNITVRVGE